MALYCAIFVSHDYGIIFDVIAPINFSVCGMWDKPSVVTIEIAPYKCFVAIEADSIEVMDG